MDKKYQVTFEPGCFDNFEGTQEELDAIIKLVKEMAENGTLFDNSELLPDDYSYNDEHPEVNTVPRVLH